MGDGERSDEELVLGAVENSAGLKGRSVRSIAMIGCTIRFLRVYTEGFEPGR